MYCEGLLTDKGIDVQNTGGSIDNLMGMTSKKFHMGWVQEDVLQYFAKSDPTRVNRNRLKVVADGMEETVHILLPVGWKPESSGGWFSNLFDDAPEGISLALLKDQTIGSWGGSLVSAKALNSFAGLGMNIVEIPEAKRAAPQLPMLLVGGQPYATVQNYLDTGKYILVGVNADDIIARAPFYIKTTANYSVGGKLMNTPTFAVKALMMGVAFRSDARNADMISLAQCINESLIDLADDPETSPLWASMYESAEAGAMVNWPYFSLN